MSRSDFSGPSILILDCSTSRGSMALALKNGAIYWRADFEAGRGHGGKLFQSLEEAVRLAKRVHASEGNHLRELHDSMRALGYEVRAEPDDAPRTVPDASHQFLSEIFVGLGPGSYSGVRQAIAAANGLAMTTGARLSGFASPLALKTDARECHAIGDARRGAFYYTAMESRTQDWTVGTVRGMSVVSRRCVEGPELLAGIDALRTRLAARPDWPVVAVENVPGGLPAETPVAWPSALRLPLGTDLVRCPPPLEPIYLRPVSITLPNAAKPVVP